MKLAVQQKKKKDFTLVEFFLYFYLFSYLLFYSLFYLQSIKTFFLILSSKGLVEEIIDDDK